MSYLDLAETLIKPLEGCRLTGYPDSVGKATIGYGHTGPEVRVGETISQEIADRYLLMDLGTADRRLSEVCYPSSLGKLPDHRRAALVSFVFNVGAEAAWTIWKDIDDDNLSDVPAQLRRFVNGRIGGKLTEIPGLEHRREAEIVYWNTADQAAAVAVATVASAVQPPPSHTTVTADTPPTPVPAPPLANTSLVAKAATAIGGGAVALGSAAQQIHQQIVPYVDTAKIFATLDTVAVGGIIAAGVVGVMIHFHQTAVRQV